MSGDTDNFDNLGPAGQGIAAFVRRTRLVVFACVGLSVLLSWLLLGAMARQSAVVAGPDGAPGDAILRRLPDLPFAEALGAFVSLCLSPVTYASPPALFALWAMWALMSVAMMLPSAAPMIRTYCELADTAASRGKAAVHPLVLVAGYLTVWLTASLAFAALTFALQDRGAPFTPLAGAAGGGALIVAGLYQFSALKESCLKKCRNPFAILFSRWTTNPADIYRLGVEQGLWCLGCCWALMLVMFAVGIMNIFWMALIGVFTLWEKQAKGAFPSRAAGLFLLVWGAALILAR